MKVSTFLTAEWRKLAMANYAVDRHILERYVPAGTELDVWQDTCYVSLVGFMFLNTKVKGFAIPFHTSFEEVNLRFYVRCKDKGTWKRGTVFIKEIVPRAAITFVANTIYKENYETMPMAHTWLINSDRIEVEYRWKKKDWNSFRIVANATPVAIEKESEQEFITEHYWGYSRVNEFLTSQYEVAHPRWMTYPVESYFIDADFSLLYGEAFASLVMQKPQSVLLAEGSAVSVKAGSKLRSLI